MVQRTCEVSWEIGGQLPALSGGGRPRLSEDEIEAAEELMEEAGVVVFRDFDMSVDGFRELTKRLGSSFSLEKWAPHALSQAGPHIGLHTEQAFTASIPSGL